MDLDEGRMKVKLDERYLKKGGELESRRVVSGGKLKRHETGRPKVIYRLEQS